MSFPNTYAATRPPRKHPCPDCPKRDNCKAICIARARWWDKQMAKVRKKMGVKKEANQ